MTENARTSRPSPRPRRRSRCDEILALIDACLIEAGLLEPAGAATRIEA